MTHIVVHHPRRIMAVFALLLLVSGYGLSQIQVNSSLVSEFRPSDPIRQADTILNTHFAGTNALDVMIDSGKQDGVLEPTFMKGMAQLQTVVEAESVVGDSSSIAEFLAEMNKVMHEGQQAYRVPPENSQLAAQYLLLYSFSGAPDDFDSFVTSDYRQAHIRIQMKTDSSADAAHLIQVLESNSKTWFSGAKVTFAGTAYTTHQFSDLIIRGQIQSLVLALSFIFILCFFMFRRFVDAALAILPVSMAIAVIYGAMGLLGLPLEIGTEVTGSMALGIGVDFAIHYLYRYRDYEAQGMTHAHIVAHSNEDTGRALMFNALVVIGGFLVLVTAHLYPQMKLGLLISSSMAICYLASCYLFPVLLASKERS
jgi:predicted RND superfamily exporter protein